MANKSKHSLYLDDEIYAGFCDLAAEQNITLGRMFEVLYNQYLFDTLKKEHIKNETSMQLKGLQKQIDLLNGQSEMLIQMANTLGIKFNFQQLIDTNINESPMVHDAKLFVAAKRQSQIVAKQSQQQDILNN